MMSESYAKIEAYLQDEMDAKERKAFEKACAEDTNLAEEFAFYLQAREASAGLVRENRKKALIDRYHSQPYKGTIPATWLFSAAAVLVILIGSYWAISQFKSPPTLPDLLAQHLVQYKLPPASGNRDLGDDKSSRDWGLVKEAYMIEDYERSLALCRQLDSKLPATELSEYYLLWGISALKMDENVEAARVLKKVLSMSIYSQEASWFESLAYLKAEQEQEARNALNIIATNPDHYRHKQAAELLEVME